MVNRNRMVNLEIMRFPRVKNNLVISLGVRTFPPRTRCRRKRRLTGIAHSSSAIPSAETTVSRKRRDQNRLVEITPSHSIERARNNLLDQPPATLYVPFLFYFEYGIGLSRSWPDSAFPMTCRIWTITMSLLDVDFCHQGKSFCFNGI